MIASPFEREHADAWATDFIDVPSLNAQATEVVLERIRQTRERAHTGNHRPSSILILGPAGAGKTHLFGRWRRACGVQAAFVLIRPEIGVLPSPRQVLAAALDALGRTSFSSTHRQLDVVVGVALAAASGGRATFPMATLDEARAMPEQQREELVLRALDHIEQLHEGIDPTWLERLLRTPFVGPTERRAAMCWLSGREPDETQLARLGLRQPLADSSVLPALRTLAAAASFGAPLVLVFDQLENLLGDGEDGSVHVHAHARLVSELHDAVPGLIVVQMALDAEWQRRISPLLSAAERTRVEATRLALELPTAQQRDALLRAWIERLDPAERGGPYPAPFTADQVRAWLADPTLTPRQLMIRCREALARRDQGDDEPSVQGASGTALLAERLEALWTAQVERARAEIDAAAAEKRGLDRERVRAGLLVGLRVVAGDDARIDAAPAGAHHDLVVSMGDRTVHAYVLQQVHWRSVGATLQRVLADPSPTGRRKPRSARIEVRVLRERALPIPPTWQKVTEQLAELRAARPGAFVEMDRYDLARVVAMHDLVASARSQDLADAAGRPIPVDAVTGWLKETLEPAMWPLLRAAQGLPIFGHDDDLAGEAAAPDAVPVPAAASKPPAATQPTPAPAPQPATDRAPASGRTAAPAASAPDGPALAVLRRLRLASVERLLREARAGRPELRRADLLRELRSHGDRVRWFGRSIVGLARPGSPAPEVRPAAPRAAREERRR